jgi:hypothetical protein
MSVMWKMEEALVKNAVCHRFYLTYTESTLSGKLSKGLETSK